MKKKYKRASGGQNSLGLEEGCRVNIKRYVNGKEIAEEDLKKIVITDEAIDAVLREVNKRLKDSFRQTKKITNIGEK